MEVVVGPPVQCSSVRLYVRGGGQYSIRIRGYAVFLCQHPQCPADNRLDMICACLAAAPMHVHVHVHVQLCML